MRKTVKFLLSLFMLMLLMSEAALASDVALTSVGQSPDAMMVKVVLKKLGVDPLFDPLMTVETLEDSKVLVAVVGGSSKGLGAAGIDKNQEIDRATVLLTGAKSKGVRVLVMHVGKEGRRGTLSDAFISAAVPLADKLIVVDGGNEDGLFESLVEGSDIEILTARSVRTTSKPLGDVLNAWNVATR